MDTFSAVAQKLSQDPAAWQRVQSELANAADRRGRLIELASEYGFTLNAEEISQVLDRAGRELKEDELEGVAGGTLGFASSTETQLIGLLLPAVQKVRDAAGR